MARATWMGALLADSDTYEMVEGNVYFPPDRVERAYLRPSPLHTECSWKGTASYFDIVVADETNVGAAWYYPHPLDAASNIRDHVAFWKGVEVTT